MFGLGSKRSDISKSSGDDETLSQLSNDAEQLSQQDVADGEYLTLVNALEEPSPPLAAEIRASIRQSFSTVSDSGGGYYGYPLTAEQAAAEMPAEQDGKGLGWFATIIPDKFFVDGKLQRGLNKKDFDIDNHTIKPRRASIPVTETDLFSSLTKIEGPDGSKRYIFHGVLNGWPALQNLELVSLEQKRDVKAIPNPKDLLMGKLSWTTVWQASQEGAKGMEPALKDHTRIHRAKLRAAPWSAIGWSKTSPGFVFWFEAQREEGARVCFGTDMTHQLSNQDKCTNVFMISHRYGRVKESAKDRITYHSICLLEWDHGNYCTVVESAYLNGMGGYQGKSNWYDDRDDGMTALYQNLPPEMIAPWRSNSAEVRCYDVPYKTHEDFKTFVLKYQGVGNRFIDPQFHFSHPARLTFRSKAQIAQYLINYISRDTSYAELARNCQTFCADFCSFLAGKKGIVPFHPVSRVEYSNRTYFFLYDSSMYESKQAKKAKQKRATGHA